ncbi:MAG TPA: hypothetical protein VML19_02830 [Verrucomicrobiae bacterium]|nr:hypothetical protein [Verrucomicrobiae bacterium]
MIVIRYSDGAGQEGVLLSVQGEMMRIAGKGSDDVLEFRLIHGKWVSENCEVVTFEFPLAIFEAIGIAPSGKETSLAAPVAEVQPCAGEVFIN